MDDGLVGSNNAMLNTEMIDYLSKTFQMRIGKAEQFVGLTINRDRRERTIHLSQENYILKMLKRFTMENCFPVNTPFEPGHDTTAGVEGNSTAVPYREAVGCLLYLSSVSRPHIA